MRQPVDKGIEPAGPAQQVIADHHQLVLRDERRHVDEGARSPGHGDPAYEDGGAGSAALMDSDPFLVARS